MPTLVVKDFACIEYAEIDLARLTVIIGPQSSGKSLLSKLIYFCSEIVTNFVSEDTFSIEKFRSQIERRFIEWFPPSAWGKKRFLVKYTAGPVEFDFTRHATSRASGNKVRFASSEFFTVQYEQASLILRDAFARVRDEPTPDRRAVLDVYWELRYQESRRLYSAMGPNAIEYQLYIPAGRSFFLNLGTAYTATRESHALDPITNQFGQYFSFAKSRIERQGKVSLEELATNSAQLSQKLLGGELAYQKDSLVLSAPDGRILPVSILSSGQQELLPLWLMLNFWGPIDNLLIFIEEPEAHLFPASQSLLTEFLIQHLNKREIEGNLFRNTRMVLTTHSPYILSKINNLLKAGALATYGPYENKEAINEVIKSDYWLLPGSTRAYGICDGRTKLLIEDGGLIDSEYLDGISGAIVEEFSKLQDIEFSAWEQ